MKKKYCRNCKYFRVGLGDYINYCFHKSNIDYDVMGYSSYKKTVFMRNENYNCKDYKKKWYKFWIKD